MKVSDISVHVVGNMYEGAARTVREELRIGTLVIYFYYKLYLFIGV